MSETVDQDEVQVNKNTKMNDANIKPSWLNKIVQPIQDPPAMLTRNGNHWLFSSNLFSFFFSVV